MTRLHKGLDQETHYCSAFLPFHSIHYVQQTPKCYPFFDVQKESSAKYFCFPIELEKHRLKSKASWLKKKLFAHSIRRERWSISITLEINGYFAQPHWKLCIQFHTHSHILLNEYHFTLLYYNKIHGVFIFFRYQKNHTKSKQRIQFGICFKIETIVFNFGASSISSTLFCLSLALHLNSNHFIKCQSFKAECIQTNNNRGAVNTSFKCK